MDYDELASTSVGYKSRQRAQDLSRLNSIPNPASARGSAPQKAGTEAGVDPRLRVDEVDAIQAPMQMPMGDTRAFGPLARTGAVSVREPSPAHWCRGPQSTDTLPAEAMRHAADLGVLAGAGGWTDLGNTLSRGPAAGAIPIGRVVGSAEGGAALWTATSSQAGAGARSRESRDDGVASATTARTHQVGYITTTSDSGSNGAAQRGPQMPEISPLRAEPTGYGNGHGSSPSKSKSESKSESKSASQWQRQHKQDGTLSGSGTEGT